MKKALILGDSNTWGYDPRGYLQRYDLTYVDYLNDLVADWMFFEDALNGRLLHDVKDETYDLANIDLFCIMLGSNDLMHYYDVNQIISFMHELIDSLDIDKVMILCPPILQIDVFKEASIQLNEAYKEMKVPCLDCNPLNMSFDGVHLSEKGHKELALKMAVYMKKDFCLKSC